jgi:integrase
MFRETKRSVRLSVDQCDLLSLALAHTHHSDLRHYILLLISTGVQKSHIDAMRWSEIDSAGQTWTIPRSANGAPAIIHLDELSVQVLVRRIDKRSHSPFVFPGVGQTGHVVDMRKPWRQLLSEFGLPALHFNDLRYISHS